MNLNRSSELKGGIVQIVLVVEIQIESAMSNGSEILCI